MTQSKDYPQVTNLKGKVMVPCNVRAVAVSHDDTEGAAYKYDVIELDQPGPFYMYQSLVWRKLQSDLQAYIYGQYDPGEQATLTGYAIRAATLGRQDIVDVCLPVQAWIDDVLAYYDAKKTAVFAAIDMPGLMAVTWDFAADKPNTGRVDWRDVKEMFNE